MALRNLLTEWSWLVVDSFAASSVRQVVISPGSRSTSLVAAALAHPQLDCVSLIDERVAAFYALGMARASGSPALLVCTSGTAGAHYYPAILEARMSRLPLLVITADRPVELRDCGAPQTLDQTHLFGQHVNAFVELGGAEAEVDALRGLRRRIVQGVARSLAPVAGPVHFNFPARKPLEPLEPGASLAPNEAALEREVRRLTSHMPTTVSPASLAPDPDAIDRLAAQLLEARSGLIVAGPLPLSRQAGLGELARRLADSLGVCFAPEATSGMRYPSAGCLDNFTMLMKLVSISPELEGPELILQIGGPPVSSAWPGFLAHGSKAPRLFVLSEAEWSDPTQSAERIVTGSLDLSLRALFSSIESRERAGGPETARRDFEGSIREIDASLTVIAAELLTEQRASSEPQEAAVTRALVEALPAGALLSVGNSLPIRLLEEWGGARGEPLLVGSQRGVNGIDGLVAGFAGTVRAFEKSDESALPMAVLLIGDVSALHDLGGFAALRQIERTATAVVILNNRGGRIFEQLPISGRLEQDEAMAEGSAFDFWTTPHDTDLENIARLFSLSYQTVCNHQEFVQAISAQEPEVVVIEVPVPRSGVEDLNRQLESRLR